MARRSPGDRRDRLDPGLPWLHPGLSSHKDGDDNDQANDEAHHHDPIRGANFRDILGLWRDGRLKERVGKPRVRRCRGGGGKAECCAEQSQDQTKSNGDEGPQESSHKFSTGNTSSRRARSATRLHAPDPKGRSTCVELSISRTQPDEFYPLYVLARAFEV